MVSKNEANKDLQEFTFENKNYECNIEYHDELEKLPQYIAKSFTNLQQAEKMLITKAKPSIKSWTISSFIDDLGFIDPVIRKKRGKNSEVFKAANKIQFFGPQILKASEGLISTVEQHQGIVKESIKQLKGKHLKEITELNNRLSFVEKQSKKNMDEAKLKIRMLNQELKKSHANTAALQKKLAEATQSTTVQTKNAEFSDSRLAEFNEMKSFINFYHQNLLKAMPSYREKMKMLPRHCSYSTLQKVIFLHLGEQTHSNKKTNVENPETSDEPLKDSTNQDLSLKSIKQLDSKKDFDESINIGSQCNNSKFEFILEREEEQEQENEDTEYYNCKIRTPSMLREFFEDKISKRKD